MLGMGTWRQVEGERDSDFSVQVHACPSTVPLWLRPSPSGAEGWGGGPHRWFGKSRKQKEVAEMRWPHRAYQPPLCRSFGRPEASRMPGACSGLCSTAVNEQAGVTVPGL